METGRRRSIPHLLICFVILSLMLVICCATSSIAQADDVVSPPLRQQRNWIVGHRGGEAIAAQSLVPGCTDLCLNALSPGETLVGLSVELYPCQDSDNSLFQYNDTFKTITMWDPTFNVNRCLDAGQSPPAAGHSPFTLQECDATAANQQWTFQADGRIRSGLLKATANSTTSQTLIMEGNGRQPDLIAGLNTFSLYLGTGGGKSDVISSFKLVPYASPLSDLSELSVALPKPSNGNVDMIMNGDFERCGYNPGPSSIADFSSSTWWFIICYWTISRGSVQLVSPGLWADDPKGGNITLHLNGYEGPGAVSQLITAKAGSNYSLSFDLAGDVTLSCGSTTKTLNVSVSPSSLPMISLSFDVSRRTTAEMGWMSRPMLNFTAYGTSINFTFQSTTNGSCGPLIDNVAVRKAQDKSASSDTDDSSDHGDLLKVLTITGGVAVVAVLTLGLVCYFWIWKRKKCRDFEVRFVKCVSCQSAKDVLDVGFKSGSESFSRKYGMQYSWEELERATGNFGKVLGDGSSCALFFAEFQDGLLGAVMVDTYRRQWTSDEVFKQEVALLCRLHHAYLVSVIGVCLGQGCRRALIFEYMPNGNLFDRLHDLQDKEPLSWQNRMVIAYQVACALEYLHEEASPPLVHRDVQASNILLQKDDSAKLAAYDVSRTSRSSSIASSRSSFDSWIDLSIARRSDLSFGHLDHAYNKSGRVSKKGDVYSYGALLLEIISGLLPAEVHPKSAGVADNPNLTEEIVRIVDPNLMGNFNEQELSGVVDIAVKCLKTDGKSRPSMIDVVSMLKTVFSASRPRPAELITITMQDLY